MAHNNPKFWQQYDFRGCYANVTAKPNSCFMFRVFKSYWRTFY